MYLRVSLTDRCNLRCTYCLPEKARFLPQALSSEQLHLLMTQVCNAAAVHKIRITGGEPTLCDDLIDIVAHGRHLVGNAVAMTSNGILLEPLLPALQEAGLRWLNISLDGITPESFRKASRRDGLSKVLSSIRRAKNLGFSPLKVNCVATQETDIAEMVRFACYEGIHLRFIELMEIGPSRDSHQQNYISAKAMRGRLAAAGIALQQRSDLDQPTSRVWSIDDYDPLETSVGFITTNSAPFCATCDRLRLTSQGFLHTCLFDEQGHDLKKFMGHSEQQTALIRQAVNAKKPAIAFQRDGVMAAIGG